MTDDNEILSDDEIDHFKHMPSDHPDISIRNMMRLIARLERAESLSGPVWLDGYQTGAAENEAGYFKQERDRLTRERDAAIQALGSAPDVLLQLSDMWVAYHTWYYNTRARALKRK